MHRDTNNREFNLDYDSLLPINDSLIIQLCEHMFHSGFVFQNSTTKEIEAGEWVIRDFFDQQQEVFFELVTRDRLKSFINYLGNLDFSSEQLKKKLRQRIIKAFDQLSKGRHHHFNIRKNISSGLNKKDNHPLYDLLMYIETYYNQVLEKNINQQEYQINDIDFKKNNFNLEDLEKLRKKIQGRLMGREFVKRFLKEIAKERGVSYKSLVFKETKKERPFPRIKFFKPKFKSFQDKNKNNLIKTSKNYTLKNKSDVVELSSQSILENYKEKKLTTQFKQDLGVSILESEETINIESKKGDYSKKRDKNNEPQVSSTNNILVHNSGNSDKDEHLNIEEENVYNNPISSASYDNDVVFGSKEITISSMKNFVLEYPDSALKFIFRKNLDGKPLLIEINAIYNNWEQRGLLKKNLEKYVLELLECPKFPDLPNHKLLQTLREKIYEVSKNNRS